MGLMTHLDPTETLWSTQVHAFTGMDCDGSEPKAHDLSLEETKLDEDSESDDPISNSTSDPISRASVVFGGDHGQYLMLGDPACEIVVTRLYESANSHHESLSGYHQLQKSSFQKGQMETSTSGLVEFRRLLDSDPEDIGLMAESKKGEPISEKDSIECEDEVHLKPNDPNTTTIHHGHDYGYGYSSHGCHSQKVCGPDDNKNNFSWFMVRVHEDSVREDIVRESDEYDMIQKSNDRVNENDFNHDWLWILNLMTRSGLGGDARLQVLRSRL